MVDISSLHLYKFIILPAQSGHIWVLDKIPPATDANSGQSASGFSFNLHLQPCAFYVISIRCHFLCSYLGITTCKVWGKESRAILACLYTLRNESVCQGSSYNIIKSVPDPLHLPCAFFVISFQGHFLWSYLGITTC